MTNKQLFQELRKRIRKDFGKCKQYYFGCYACMANRALGDLEEALEIEKEPQKTLGMVGTAGQILYKKAKQLCGMTITPPNSTVLARRSGEQVRDGSPTSIVP